MHSTISRYVCGGCLLLNPNIDRLFSPLFLCCATRCSCDRVENIDPTRWQQVVDSNEFLILPTFLIALAWMSANTPHRLNALWQTSSVRSCSLSPRVPCCCVLFAVDVLSVCAATILPSLPR